MIIGLGTDIVNIERIEKICAKFDDHFVSKLFTISEQADIEKVASAGKKRCFKIAKFFAAKEAVSKALGTGFSNGVSWQDIEISHDEKGRPLVKLDGAAAKRATVLSCGENFQVWLSLSDDYPWAQAVVIIEKI